MFQWLLIALFSCSFSVVAANKAQPVVSKVTPQEIDIKTHTKKGNLILGEKEWIYIKPLNRNILSRVDTGATSSSISAIDINTYKQGGKSFVDFKLAHKKWQSEILTYPVTRWGKVIQSTTDTPSVSRPVIQLDVQVGDYKTKTDFTLTDRTHLQYPVLLGRTFIDNVAVVDVSHKYIQPRVKIEKSAKQEEIAKTDSKEKPAEK